MSKKIEVPAEDRYPAVKSRKGKHQPGTPPSPRIPTTKGGLIRTAKGAPEVMVKITNSRSKANGKAGAPIKSRNMTQIKGSVKYISRDGTVPLEDENGFTYIGKDATTDALYTWPEGAGKIPETDGTRREALNIVLSMPPGTDRDSVTKAGRNFVAAEFKNHQYVFATHNDGDHPHVHVIVKMSGIDGKRLNPRKADLQRWREGFAEKLRDQGIEANATPRPQRGVAQKARKAGVANIGKRSSPDKRVLPPMRLLQQMATAAHENGGQQFTTTKAALADLWARTNGQPEGYGKQLAEYQAAVKAGRKTEFLRSQVLSITTNAKHKTKNYHNAVWGRTADYYERLGDSITSEPHVNPLKTKIEQTRQSVLAGYREISKRLANGNSADKQLAVDIVGLVKSMPSTESRHDVLVKSLKQEQGQTQSKGRAR